MSSSYNFGAAPVVRAPDELWSLRKVQESREAASKGRLPRASSGSQPSVSPRPTAGLAASPNWSVPVSPRVDPEAHSRAGAGLDVAVASSAADGLVKKLRKTLSGRTKSIRSPSSSSLMSQGGSPRGGLNRSSKPTSLDPFLVGATVVDDADDEGSTDVSSLDAPGILAALQSPHSPALTEQVKQLTESIAMIRSLSASRATQSSLELVPPPAPAEEELQIVSMGPTKPMLLQDSELAVASRDALRGDREALLSYSTELEKQREQASLDCRDAQQRAIRALGQVDALTHSCERLRERLTTTTEALELRTREVEESKGMSSRLTHSIEILQTRFVQAEAEYREELERCRRAVEEDGRARREAEAAQLRLEREALSWKGRADEAESKAESLVVALEREESRRAESDRLAEEAREEARSARGQSDKSAEALLRAREEIAEALQRARRAEAAEAAARERAAAFAQMLAGTPLPPEKDAKPMDGELVAVSSLRRALIETDSRREGVERELRHSRDQCEAAEKALEELKRKLERYEGEDGLARELQESREAERTAKRAAETSVQAAEDALAEAERASQEATNARQEARIASERLVSAQAEASTLRARLADLVPAMEEARRKAARAKSWRQRIIKCAARVRDAASSLRGASGHADDSSEGLRGLRETMTKAAKDAQYWASLATDRAEELAIASKRAAAVAAAARNAEVRAREAEVRQLKQSEARVRELEEELARVRKRSASVSWEGQHHDDGADSEEEDEESRQKREALREERRRLQQQREAAAAEAEAARSLMEEASAARAALAVHGDSDSEEANALRKTASARVRRSTMAITAVSRFQQLGALASRRTEGGLSPIARTESPDTPKSESVSPSSPSRTRRMTALETLRSLRAPGGLARATRAMSEGATSHPLSLSESAEEDDDADEVESLQSARRSKAALKDWLHQGSTEGSLEEVQEDEEWTDATTAKPTPPPPPPRRPSATTTSSKNE
jgi:DNA repair exonuclease SbcCD ATPase subunit